MKIILNSKELNSVIETLANELVQSHTDLSNTAFIGIQQGGVVVADKIVELIQQKYPSTKILYGQVDITFYRDDIRKKILAPDNMNIPFSIENKEVVLIDDVLFTGRTIKAALDVLLDYGRPAKVELCVLVDRKEHRQFPIQPDFTGQVMKTDESAKVKLVTNEKGERQVVLVTASS